jgi:hypothetical protein
LSTEHWSESTLLSTSRQPHKGGPPLFEHRALVGVDTSQHFATAWHRGGPALFEHLLKGVMSTKPQHSFDPKKSTKKISTTTRLSSVLTHDLHPCLALLLRLVGVEAVTGKAGSAIVPFVRPRRDQEHRVFYGKDVKRRQCEEQGRQDRRRDTVTKQRAVSCTN